MSWRTRKDGRHYQPKSSSVSAETFNQIKNQRYPSHSVIHKPSNNINREMRSINGVNNSTYDFDNLTITLYIPEARWNQKERIKAQASSIVDARALWNAVEKINLIMV